MAAATRAHAASLGLVLVALAVGYALRQLGIANVALVFLTAVLASATIYGLWPAPRLHCERASVQFLLPAAALHLHDRRSRERGRAFFFVVVAVIASNLASRVRAQAMAARERAATTENLYLFSRKLAGVFTLDDLLWAAAFQFAQMLSMRVVILLPEAETIAVRAGYPPEDSLDDADLAAAKWVWQHGQPAGRGANTLPGRQAPVSSDGHGTGHRRRRGVGQRQAGAAAVARSAPPVRRLWAIRRRSRSSASTSLRT